VLLLVCVYIFYLDCNKEHFYGLDYGTTYSHQPLKSAYNSHRQYPENMDASSSGDLFVARQN
jgi:hypothetical protein